VREKERRVSGLIYKHKLRVYVQQDIDGLDGPDLGLDVERHEADDAGLPPRLPALPVAHELVQLVPLVLLERALVDRVPDDLVPASEARRAKRGETSEAST
jgi:hypothetical protein